MLSNTINGETLPTKFGKIADAICRHQTYDSKAFLTNIIF